MSEPIESVRVGDRATTPVHSASVRELLTELAELEDATRGPGGFAGPAGTVQPTDLLGELGEELTHGRGMDGRRGPIAHADGLDRLAHLQPPGR